MKHIKKFETLQAANGFITPKPFVGCVLEGGQVISCNEEGKKIVVDGDSIDIVDDYPVNTILHLNNGQTVEIVGTELTWLTQIGFKNTLVRCEIGTSVTSIGERAFENCSSLNSVTIPNSVTSIGERAFENCSSLNSVTIPNSVTSIGESAFEDCNSLTSIEIPNSITSIGSYAFRCCTGLTTVFIGNGVISIEDYTFLGCTGLTSVSIGNGVVSIGNEAFKCGSGHYSGSLETITVGENVFTYDGGPLFIIALGNGTTIQLSMYESSGGGAVK